MEDKLYGPDNKPLPIDEEAKAMVDEGKEPVAFLKWREVVEIKGVRFRVKSFGNRVLILEIADHLKMNSRAAIKKRR